MGDVSAVKLAKEVSADDYDTFDNNRPSKQATAQSDKKDLITSKDQEEMDGAANVAENKKSLTSENTH